MSATHLELAVKDGGESCKSKGLRAGCEQQPRPLAAWLAVLDTEGEPKWLANARRNASTAFAQVGLPTRKNEEWRYSEPRIRGLESASFNVTTTAAIPAGINLTDLGIPMLGGRTMVFVDGDFVPSLSSPLADGVQLLPLAGALADDSLQARLSLTGGQETGFDLLNTALFKDGVLVDVPKNVDVSEVFHLIFVNRIPGMATHPRVLVRLGANSRLHLIESRVCTADESLSNSVTQLQVGPGATLHHVATLEGSGNSRQLEHIAVSVAADGRFRSNLTVIGSSESESEGPSALVRVDLDVDLVGEGAECTLEGLYLGAANDHIDCHTRIDHRVPCCTSRQLYKGILAGKAKAVFNGKVLVHVDAQHSQAQQSNKNLLLSEGALVSTKPQLEIWADDVQCAHGATVGRLDEDALFYMQSRGLPKTEARKLLRVAFANEICSGVRSNPMRAHLEEVLASWLSRVDASLAVTP